MIPLIKKFFTDETAAIGFARALILGFGGAVLSGDVPILEALPKWAGILAMAAAGMIRAGERNPKP